MRFIKEADDSDKVPSLKRKQYADYKLSSTEWEHLVCIHQVLQVSKEQWQRVMSLQLMDSTTF
jgi:hypothetical protein